MKRIMARVENNHIIMEPILINASEEKIEAMIPDIYKIFSSEEIIKKHPEKRLKSLEEAEIWIARTMMGYQLETSFNHFLYLRSTGRVIGIVELIPSKALELMPSRKNLLKSYPQLKGGAEIEYWLDKQYWGQKIMSNFIKNFTNVIMQNGLTATTAFVEADNAASIAVLQNSGFGKVGELRNIFKANTLHYMKTKTMP